MKSVTNRSIMDKKKNYKQPIVEQAEMLQGSIVMAGSPTGLGVNPEPIETGQGGD